MVVASFSGGTGHLSECGGDSKWIGGFGLKRFRHPLSPVVDKSGVRRELEDARNSDRGVPRDDIARRDQAVGPSGIAPRSFNRLFSMEDGPRVSAENALDPVR